MIRRDVIYDPDALDDLHNIFKWIAAAASPRVAEDYVSRLENCIAKLDLAAERGSKRDDIDGGIRITPIGTRAIVAFKVFEDQVLILRVFYGGQDWQQALKPAAAT